METRKKFAEIVELWKADKRQYVKKSSLSAYVLLIENHLLPAFGGKYRIEEEDAQAFVFKKLSKGLSQKTVKDILIVLRMILKFGAKNKLFEYAPFEVQYPTEREKHDIEVLSRANQKKLMAYIHGHFTFKNLGVYICLSTGIRIGEICALTWDDIDTDTGIISVKKTVQRIYIIEQDCKRTELLLDTPKTKNSIRDIPMTNDLLKMLKPIKRLMNGSFFCPDQRH